MAAAEEEKALLGGDTAKVLEFNEVSLSYHVVSGTFAATTACGFDCAALASVVADNYSMLCVRISRGLPHPWLR